MQTDRIILRPWRESDAEALYKYASDPDVGPRAGWSPHKSVEESLEIIRTIFHNDHTWAKTGRFGADMKVDFVNDGPVTILLDSTEL